MAKIKFRRQRPIAGGRTPMPACVIPEIYDAVDRLADKYKVSRSFVMAVIMAEHLGIEEQESYLPQPLHRRRTGTGG